MTHLMIDRELVEKSDSEFYAGTPTLEGYSFTLSKEAETDPSIIDNPELVSYLQLKGQRRARFSLTAVNRRMTRYVANTQPGCPHIVFKPFDARANESHRLSKLVSVLASQTKSYARDVIEDAPVEQGTAEQNQAIAALLALEFSEPDDEDQFPHSALRSFSRDEGAEIDRILTAGAPDWVRELRHQLGR